MKRIFALAISCLCLMSVFGQIYSGAEQETINVNGTYLFQKAELFIRNDQTKEIVEHKVITDTASIDPHDLHLENVFLAVELLDGNFKEFILADRLLYTQDEMMQLQPTAGDKKLFEVRSEEENRHMYEGRTLRPYEHKLEGKNLIVKINKYVFGRSDYKYTQEAELILTLTKQNDDEDNI